MVLVWTRPRRSGGGIRCQRWPPASSRNVSAARLPENLSTQKPGRSSTISDSKQPPPGEAEIDAGLLDHQKLCVVAALGGTNLYDDTGHDTSFRSFNRFSRAPQNRAL